MSFRFETLSRMHKNIFFSFFQLFFFCIFGSFCRKLGILIPDLYFYDVKILPDMNQNDIKNTRKNYKMLKQIFFLFEWAGSGPNTCVNMCEQKLGILIPDLYFTT